MCLDRFSLFARALLGPCLERGKIYEMLNLCCELPAFLVIKPPSRAQLFDSVLVLIHTVEVAYHSAGVPFSPPPFPICLAFINHRSLSRAEEETREAAASIVNGAGGETTKRGESRRQKCLSVTHH